MFRFQIPVLESIDFVIYENTGRVVRPKFTKPHDDNHTWSIKVDDFKSGLHHLLVTNKDKIEWLPFIKI